MSYDRRYHTNMQLYCKLKHPTKGGGGLCDGLHEVFFYVFKYTICLFSSVGHALAIYYSILTSRGVGVQDRQKMKIMNLKQKNYKKNISFPRPLTIYCLSRNYRIWSSSLG